MEKRHYKSQFSISTHRCEFLDCLGEFNSPTITKKDNLNCLSFDEQGKYLAIGDYGGRIIIFQRMAQNEVDIYEDNESILSDS